MSNVWSALLQGLGVGVGQYARFKMDEAQIAAAEANREAAMDRQDNRDMAGYTHNQIMQEGAARDAAKADTRDFGQAKALLKIKQQNRIAAAKLEAKLSNKAPDIVSMRGHGGEWTRAVYDPESGGFEEVRASGLMGGSQTAQPVATPAPQPTPAGLMGGDAMGGMQPVGGNPNEILPGTMGSSRANPIPMSSPAQAAGYPDGTWIRTPSGQVVQKGA